MARTSARSGHELTRQLTRRLATHAAAACDTALPDTVVDRARYHILDTVAAIISGSNLEAGRQARSYVSTLGGHEQATVAGAERRTSVVHAAFANAMAAHADETDDAHPASITHPGCAVVPAALAMAEVRGTSGVEFIRSVVLGYDYCARIGIMLGAGRFLSERGFDPHAFGGCFGAAAAAGCLVLRQPTAMAYALSYAAQQSSGLATLFRDRGHVEKAFVFAGMPARNGVAAATMVAAGMTGVDDVFDGTPSFPSAFDVANDAAAAFDGLGETFEICNTNIKRWSVGSPAQAVLDSLETLLRTHRFDASAVTSIMVHLPEEGARVVNNRDMPSINVQHLVALMVIDGTVGFAASHDPARMAEPAIRALRAKVQLQPSAALSRAEPARQAIVEVTLEDGRRLDHHTRAVRGTTANPMTWSELSLKALDLMTPVIGPARARQMIEMVDGLEHQASVTGMVALLRPVAGAER